jgi:anaphase-promoting complex subunit 1
MTCLYVEPKSQPRAKKVFLASNAQASGTLSICLVIPQTKKSSSASSGIGSRRQLQFSADSEHNTNGLQILKLCPTLPSTIEANNSAHVINTNNNTGSFLPRSGYTFSVKSLNETVQPVPCINAQPLKVQPVPACFLPHPKYRCHSSLTSRNHAQMMAIDILVLSRVAAEQSSLGEHIATATNNELTLYRQGIPFLPCDLAPLALMSTTANFDGRTTIVDIVDPLGDRVTFLHCDRSFSVQNTVDMKSTRGSLTLVVASDSTEMALSAVEASLYAASKMEETDGKGKNKHMVQVALRLRADCVRLAQSISMTTEGSLTASSLSSPHSLGWSALETVFLTSLVHDLKGKFVEPKQQTIPGSKENDPWKLLLESQFHNSFDAMDSGSLYLGPLSTQDATIRSNQDSSLRECYSLHGSLVKDLAQQSKAVSSGIISRYLFDALHLMYEDCSLGARAAADGAGLICLLVQICKVVMALDPANKSAGLFLDYYKAEMGKAYMDYVARVPTVARGSVMAVVHSQFDRPPCILDWVNDVLRGRSSGSYFNQVNLTDMNAACARTRSLCRIFSILFLPPGGSTKSSTERDLEVVAALLEEGFTDQSLIREELKTGIALPLLDVLYRCRQGDSLVDVPGWSVDACLLVGREDLSKNMTEVAVHAPPLVLEDHPQSKDMTDSEQEETKKGAFSDQDNDGLLPLELSSSMWFPDDNRVHEAARLLRSSRQIFLRVPRAIEVSDHEFEQLKQKKLSLLVRRTLALPIGRGMMTMGSLRPVPAEPLPLPELCLKGRVPPTNATLTLEQNECPPDMRVWPEFHNGVAAGLRLPLKGEPGESGSKISRTWIVYNRPPRKNNQTEIEENGTTVTPPPNIKSHSHGGLLLALGLRGHLGSLRMTDIYEYLTQGAVTTTVGVLLGMAANERGSCDTAVSKMICLHIPSLIPQHFSAIDVASSVQTAAVTGAGLLFQGSSHRMMTEFLLNEIGKRPESDMSAFDREAYTLSCGLALGMVNLSLREKSDTTDRAAGIADLRVEERLRRYINGGEANEDESRRLRESNDRFSLPSAGSGADEKCSIIHEGNQINTQMTSPGATLALGLMYMKTGNHTIASAVRIPNTHFLLEFVRPDFLGLRVVAKSLILWDEVQPTKEWIEAQVPGVVQQAYYSMQAVARQAAVGRSPIKARRPADYDRRAVRQIYIYVVAGACFGIGLRFAGTGDKRAKEALFSRVVELHKLREGTDAVSLVSRPEFPTLETCLGLAAISLAMVLAGTGDLDALRLFKVSMVALPFGMFVVTILLSLNPLSFRFCVGDTTRTFRTAIT